MLYSPKTCPGAPPGSTFLAEAFAIVIFGFPALFSRLFPSLLSIASHRDGQYPIQESNPVLLLRRQNASPSHPQGKKVRHAGIEPALLPSEGSVRIRHTHVPHAAVPWSVGNRTPSCALRERRASGTPQTTFQPTFVRVYSTRQGFS